MILAGITHIAIAQADVIDNKDYNRATESYNAATAAYHNDKSELALELFQKAHKLNPFNADYPFGMATTFYKLKNYDSAASYISKAIELQKDQADYHYQAGNVFFQLKAYSKAIENYTLALGNQGNNEVFINDEICRFNRAISNYSLKRYQETESDLSWIIMRDSLNDMAYHIRGVALLKQDSDRGSEDLVEAEKLGNSNSRKYLDRYCR